MDPRQGATASINPSSSTVLSKKISFHFSLLPHRFLSTQMVRREPWSPEQEGRDTQPKMALAVSHHQPLINQVAKD